MDLLGLQPLFQQPISGCTLVIADHEVQYIQRIVALLAIFVSGPVGCVALLTDAGQRHTTFAAECLLLRMVGIAAGANVPIQHKLAVAGDTGNVTAVLPNINRM